MSVQMNTYCFIGALLPYAPFRGSDIYEKLEPYFDSAFEGIKHHDDWLSSMSSALSMPSGRSDFRTYELPSLW